MLKYTILSLLVLFIPATLLAQLANVTYDVKINRLNHLEFGCGSCWEAGDEEYTGYGRFNDNINSSVVSSTCQQCTNNGDCTYGADIHIGSRSNNAYQLTLFVDGWENDRDPRCEFNTGIIDDDCRTNVNSTFQFRELSYPSNSYNITNLSVGNCDMTGYFDVSWRYSGSSSLIPTCTQQNISVTSGKIASVAFQLIAGKTYQFGTCGATEDTYLRIYGSDGYTIVGLNDNNGPMCTGNTASVNFTPTSTGTYYVEVSRNNRSRLQSNFNLTYQDITVMPGITTTVAGGGNYCFGNNVTLVANTNAPAGTTFSWYSGSCGGTLLATTTVNSYSFIASNQGTTSYFVRLNVPGFCGPFTCESANVTLPSLNSNLSNDNESSSCVVNGNTFVEFRHSSGRLIAAVNANNQNLGNVTATSYVQTPAINIEACNSSSYITSALGRRWVITPTTQPTSPVKVRLYFSDIEYQSLQSTANSNINMDDNTATFNDLYLTKYRNDGSPTVNSVFTDNCTSGTVTIWHPGNSGNITALHTGFDANGRYIEYTINDFSEFWLHGSRQISPLPVTLQNFSAVCKENSQLISWTTGSEINCSHYIVEKSRDGQLWNVIGSVQGNGNSQSSIDYQLKDVVKNNTTTYYRLTQVDFDGKATILDVSSLDCQEKQQFSVYPNPSNGEFTVSYVAMEATPEAVLQLKDISGRTMFSQVIKIEKGVNKIYITGNSFNAGSYLIYLKGLSKEPVPIKLVID